MKKVAILIDEMFEDTEFIYPYYRLIEAGMIVDVIAHEKRLYTGKHGTAAKATHTIHGLNSNSYCGVYIPGGHAPERLKNDREMLDFVRSFYALQKPICTVCHGPSVLACAGILKGKKATAYPSIKEEIEKAGAVYTGMSVEQDENIITAQNPHSLPEMMKLFLALLEK